LYTTSFAKQALEPRSVFSRPGVKEPAGSVRRRVATVWVDAGHLVCTNAQDVSRDMPL